MPHSHLQSYQSQTKSGFLQRYPQWGTQTKVLNHNGHDHRLVHLRGVRKMCVYCQLHKIKTKSGWWVYTRYKCDMCDAPLCTTTSERDCFELYHKMMSGITTSSDNPSISSPLLSPFDEPVVTFSPGQQNLAKLTLNTRGQTF